MCGCSGFDGSNSQEEVIEVKDKKQMKFDKNTMSNAILGFAIGVGVYFIYKRFIK